MYPRFFPHKRRVVAISVSGGALKRFCVNWLYILRPPAFRGRNSGFGDRRTGERVVRFSYQAAATRFTMTEQVLDDIERMRDFRAHALSRYWSEKEEGKIGR